MYERYRFEALKLINLEFIYLLFPVNIFVKSKVDYCREFFYVAEN